MHYAIKVKFPDEDAYVFVLRPPNIFETEIMPLHFDNYNDAARCASQWQGLAVIVEYRPNLGWAHSNEKLIDKRKRL